MNSQSDQGPRTSDFDYDLPAELIAQHPPDRRDQSRLMVLDRESGTIGHRVFADITHLIHPGDVLVLNETRVFPARLRAKRPGGGDAEVLLLRPDDDGNWLALVRPGNKLKPGRALEISPELTVEILDSTPTGERIVRLHSDRPIETVLEEIGEVPLPPYVERSPDDADRSRYQTVYARHSGSVAAPTAGLHFTRDLLSRLEASGVHIARITLHVGVGTFRPVEVEDPDQHPMHAEWYEVSQDAADTINKVRGAGGAVWAVGTTTVRTLESVVTEERMVQSGSGWTDIFIRPPYHFRAVDRMITNFHLPRSTLLMLVSAFAEAELVLKGYRTAIATGYRFYSYGDAMAII